MRRPVVQEALRHHVEQRTSLHDQPFGIHAAAEHPLAGPFQSPDDELEMQLTLEPDSDEGDFDVNLHGHGDPSHDFFEDYPHSEAHINEEPLP